MSVNEYKDNRQHHNYEPGDHIDHTGHQYTDKPGNFPDLPPPKERKRPVNAPPEAKLTPKQEDAVKF